MATLVSILQLNRVREIARRAWFRREWKTFRARMVESDCHQQGWASRKRV